MKVFVLGGTGAIGCCALPALVEAGHEVTALARTREKATWVSAQGAKPVGGSIFDRAGLSRCFDGHDAVVNLATSMPRSSTFVFRRAWKPTERVRIQGSAAVVDAALCRFSAAGGTGVILRLGFFYGPTARHSQELLAMARHHLVPVFGRPDSYVSSIHLDDGGQAVVAALGARAGIFNVVDNEPLRNLEYASALAAAVGVRPWVRGPGRLALLLGDRITSLTRSLRVSNRRFREATGWQPRYLSARQGWIATARGLT